MKNEVEKQWLKTMGMKYHDYRIEKGGLIVCPKLFFVDPKIVPPPVNLLVCKPFHMIGCGEHGIDNTGEEVIVIDKANGNSDSDLSRVLSLAGLGRIDLVYVGVDDVYNCNIVLYQLINSNNKKCYSYGMYGVTVDYVTNSWM